MKKLKNYFGINGFGKEPPCWLTTGWLAGIGAGLFGGLNLSLMLFTLFINDSPAENADAKLEGFTLNEKPAFCWGLWFCGWIGADIGWACWVCNGACGADLPPPGAVGAWREGFGLAGRLLNFYWLSFEIRT